MLHETSSDSEGLGKQGDDVLLMSDVTCMDDMK
jgi:hypothetical protein